MTAIIDFVFFCYKCYAILHHNKILFATIALWLVSSEQTLVKFFLCYDAIIEQIVCYNS
jgi:hypothetical protein